MEQKNRSRFPLGGMPGRGLLDKLATRYVGGGKRAPRLFFASSRRGVVAIFTSRQDAISFARPRDLYVEGPQGEELHASWS